MVFGEYDFTLVAKLLSDQLLHPDLFFDPKGNGFEKGSNARRGACQVGVQDAIEFDERLFVKCDKINLVNPDSPLAQAIFDRKFRKGGIVFFAAETLFLSGGDDPAVPHQTRGAVMVKRRNSEYTNSA